MRSSTLASPGVLANGLRLRTEAAKAISYVEVLAGKQGGTTEAAVQLAAFFTACAAAATAVAPIE